jgi:hypothetical protein
VRGFGIPGLEGFAGLGLADADGFGLLGTDFFANALLPWVDFACVESANAVAASGRPAETTASKDRATKIWRERTTAS